MRLILCALLVVGCNPTGKTSDPKPERPGSDWPCFLGPTYNSVSTETGILKEWPKEGLKVVWEADLGIGYAPPTIAKGRLYHADRFGDAIRTTCRDSLTGKEIWTHEYPTDYEDFYGYDPGPRACPVVDDGRVYIHGPDGVLVCIDAAQGKEVWKIDTMKTYGVQQNFFGVGSVPLVFEDLLIVPVGGSPKGNRPDDFRDMKGNGTGIIAFDKKTGKEKYRTTDELASYSSPILATIDDRPWAFYFSRNGLIGFDPKNGKVDVRYKWRARAMESANAANPVVVKDQVLITECYDKGAALLQVKSGEVKEIWTDADAERDEKRLMCHWNTPVHADGYVYASSARHEPQAELRCVRLSDGQLMWKEPDLSRSSLTLIDRHFLCLTERGVLILLKVNPKKYDEVARWKTGLKYPTWAAPIVSHGLLYLRGRGKLICCELIPEKK
jgi:outer membrane protein assembly factor BamB